MKYLHYLSFGFNCEVGFALQHLGVFEPTLFSWADVRGTASIVSALRDTDALLSGRVRRYSSNMFFCHQTNIGFHGKLLFSDAVNQDGSVDLARIDASLVETMNRIRYLASKQAVAIANGRCLIVVKFFADIFEEKHSISESMQILRSELRIKYNTDDFSLLFVAEGDPASNRNVENDFIRYLPRFSPRSNAGAIDKEGWERLMSEFIAQPSVVASRSAPDFSVRWWNLPTVTRHINKLLCGQLVDGLEGVGRKLCAGNGGSAIESGISVQCGNGAKEIRLVKDGVVKFFALYDSRPDKVAEGRELAKLSGVHEQVSFNEGGMNDTPLDVKFDLVFWHSTLQNVPNVHDALLWSRRAVNDGGQVFVYGYLGPSRFQWSEGQIGAANSALSVLPHEFRVWANLIGPVSKPELSYNKANPHEAADSGQILEVARRLFSNVDVVHTGGVVYHIALGQSAGAMRGPGVGATLLPALLLCDELYAKSGLSIFGVLIARK